MTSIWISDSTGWRLPPSPKGEVLGGAAWFMQPIGWMNVWNHMDLSPSDVAVMALGPVAAVHPQEPLPCIACKGVSLCFDARAQVYMVTVPISFQVSFSGCHPCRRDDIVWEVYTDASLSEWGEPESKGGGCLLKPVFLVVCRHCHSCAPIYGTAFMGHQLYVK